MPSVRRRVSWARPSRLWMPVTVAVALVTAGAVAVHTPHESLVNPDELRIRPTDPPLSLGEPQVSYQLDGAGRAQVSYVADTGELATDGVTLPWTHDIKLPSPMRPVSVTASVASRGEVTCRIVVDGVRRDTRTSDAGAGVVLCSVVSA